MSDQPAFSPVSTSKRHHRLFRQACRWLEANLEDSDVRVYETPRDTPTGHAYALYSPGVWVDVLWLPERDMGLDVFPVTHNGQPPARWRYYVTTRKQLEAALASFTAQRQSVAWADIKDLPAVLLLEHLLQFMVTGKKVQKAPTRPRNHQARPEIIPSDKVIIFPIRQ